MSSIEGISSYFYSYRENSILWVWVSTCCTDCRCEREEAERLLGSEVTGSASGRQRHDVVYGDWRHDAGRRPTHSWRHWWRHARSWRHRRRQFHHLEAAFTHRRQWPGQGSVLGARSLSCALPRCQRYRHAPAAHSRYTYTFPRTCLSLCFTAHFVVFRVPQHP